MDLRDLQYFEAIAGLEHLGRAAQALHRTQPALTKSVHRLEEELDVKLFERVGRGIRLTSAGKALFERARHLRVAMQDTTAQIKGHARGIAGRVRIGVAPTLAQYLLPEALRAYLAEAPDVMLEMKIGILPLLRERLVNGQLDLLIGAMPKVARDFVTHPLVEDRVVVVAAASHEIMIFEREYSTGVYLLAPGTEVIGSLLVSLWSTGGADLVAALSLINVVLVGIGLAVALRFGVKLHD